MSRTFKDFWWRLTGRQVVPTKYPVGQIIYKSDGEKWCAFKRYPKADREFEK